MTTLHARHTFVGQEPGWPLSTLIALVALSATALIVLATLTTSSGTVQTTSPSIETPAPSQVNCWDSPVC